MSSPEAQTTAQTGAYRRDPDAKRELLLQAARRVFSQHGYAGATTAQIAAEAGVSEGILFHHFGSKRELFASVASAYGRGLAEAMFGSYPGDEQVSAADSIRRAFAYVRTHRALHRLFIVRDPQLSWVHDAAREEIVGALEAAFRSGSQRGNLRPMDSRIVAELMYALVGGALEACFEHDGGMREEAYLNETIRCVAGALAPLSPRNTHAPPSREENEA